MLGGKHTQKKNFGKNSQKRDIKKTMGKKMKLENSFSQV